MPRDSGGGVTALLVSPTGASYLFDPCEPTEMVPAAGRRVLLALVVCVASPLAAQQRHYLAEIGAAGSYQSFDSLAQLKGAPGVLLRGVSGCP